LAPTVTLKFAAETVEARVARATEVRAKRILTVFRVFRLKGPKGVDDNLWGFVRTCSGDDNESERK
jgi:hypothetical protein